MCYNSHGLVSKKVKKAVKEHTQNENVSRFSQNFVLENLNRITIHNKTFFNHIGNADSKKKSVLGPVINVINWLPITQIR